MSKIKAQERISPDEISPWWGEHLSRYHFAGKYVRDKVVLDVGCGTGLGVDSLIDYGARQIIGVDISWAAVSEVAREESGRVDVCQSDATALPLVDGTVDVIVCFETLEHVSSDLRLIGELRRVLRPEGQLLLSTPNALHSRPTVSTPRNPFHRREYVPEQLRVLLLGAFSEVTLVGQHTSSEFGVSPFWTLRERIPRDLGTRMRLLCWKIITRLPDRVGNSLSRFLLGHALYPAEGDFIFTKDGLATGHVILAICQGERNG